MGCALPARVYCLRSEHLVAEGTGVAGAIVATPPRYVRHGLLWQLGSPRAFRLAGRLLGRRSLCSLGLLLAGSVLAFRLVSWGDAGGGSLWSLALRVPPRGFGQWLCDLASALGASRLLLHVHTEASGRSRAALRRAVKRGELPWLRFEPQEDDQEHTPGGQKSGAHASVLLSGLDLGLVGWSTRCCSAVGMSVMLASSSTGISEVANSPPHALAHPLQQPRRCSGAVVGPLGALSRQDQCAPSSAGGVSIEATWPLHMQRDVDDMGLIDREGSGPPSVSAPRCARGPRVPWPDPHRRTRPMRPASFASGLVEDVPLRGAESWGKPKSRDGVVVVSPARLGANAGKMCVWWRRALVLPTSRNNESSRWHPVFLQLQGGMDFWEAHICRFTGDGLAFVCGMS